VYADSDTIGSTMLLPRVSGLFRCLLFLAREISDKAFLTAKELTLVPVFKRRLLHIVLD
jgi:hypothetical protein